VGDVSHSQHFEYHNEVTEPLCSGLLPLLDRHAEAIGGLLGLSLGQSAQPFAYYRCRDLETCSAVPEDAGGVAIGDTVISPKYFDTHELAHAYLYRVTGEGAPSGLLREGAAVALSCDHIETLPTTSYDWRSLLHPKGHAEYTLAGHFVTYLVRDYGVEPFLRFYRAIPQAVTTTDFELEFARFYPISMDRAWQNAITPGPFWELKSCLGAWECSAPEPLEVGTVATEDCGNGFRRQLTVGSQEGGVVISHNGGALAVWQTCWEDAGPCLAVGADNEDTLHWMVMDPGTYSLTSLSGRKTKVLLAEYIPGRLLGDSCVEAGEVRLDAQARTRINFPKGRKLSGWIRLTGAVGRTYEFLPANLPVPDGALSLCNGCGPSSTCVPLTLTQPSVFVAEGSLLQVQNLSTSTSSLAGGGLEGMGLWFTPTRGGADQ
jgi:hypothetical protein